MKRWLFLGLVSLLTVTANAQSSFAVIGDYGANNTAEAQVADAVKKHAPDIVLTVGDNNYYNGCMFTIDSNIGKYYAEFIGKYKGIYGKGATENRFFPSLGNHDWNAQYWCLEHGTLPYLEYFSLPGTQRYYDFVKGSVHFFALDSDPHEPDGNTIGSVQYQWLKQVTSKSKACFKVAYFHHPSYSSGEHGSQPFMQWDFKTLGIDVVLTGHDHHYERIEHDGIVYYVNGVGGASLSRVGEKVAGSKYSYNKKHGFMMAEEDNGRLVITFYDKDNALKDSRVITKDCS